MYLVVNVTEAFVGTGGRKFDPALPLVVFVHGAGLDHTVWALLTRWFYRSTRIGEVFFADAKGNLPMRRMVRGISRVYKGEAPESEMNPKPAD